MTDAVIPPVEKTVLATPPDTLLSAVLNATQTDRRRMRADSEIRIHVSDIMRTDKDTAFCPREHAIVRLERLESGGRRISPGANLLFAQGHAIHDHIRNQFIERSPFGHLAWGNWRCHCAHLRIERKCWGQVRDTRCDRCHLPPTVYEEIDLYSPRFKLVGHPDFYVKWGKTLYIYEIKTIERADIDFDEINAPLGDHVLQASFYYHLSTYMRLPVATRLRFLYTDRSTRKMFVGYPYRELQANASPASRLEPFFNKATALIRGVETGRLPARICENITCSRAKRCRVALSCFANGDVRDAKRGPITINFPGTAKVADVPRGIGRFAHRDRNSFAGRSAEAPVCDGDTHEPEGREHVDAVQPSQEPRPAAPTGQLANRRLPQSVHRGLRVQDNARVVSTEGGNDRHPKSRFVRIRDRGVHGGTGND